MMEKPGPMNGQNTYFMTIGRQYLNTRNYGKAAEFFKKVPSTAWNADTKPLVANAFYNQNDYGKTIELLETTEVKKTYPVLQMLANSSIELKRYRNALQYLKKLRQYGDTKEINHLLASTYLCMGNRKKAKEHYDYARGLKK